jgi:DNA mismatch endonuclease (patch repair protein)
MDISPKSIWQLGYQVAHLLPGLYFNMVDIVDSKTRSKMMSGIKGKNTRPEMIIRKRLHALGYRFRIHRRDLPGSPDVVLPMYKAVILVNGCYWHGHNCRLFKWPRTRCAFWRQKILGNIDRDERNLVQLDKLGWRICVVWECEVRGVAEKRLDSVISSVVVWLSSDKKMLHLPHSCRQESPRLVSGSLSPSEVEE